ncbi:MAG: hypothetical protein JJ900_09780 [Rhodospirillales bacterium]|nr:hypothetical protein [Rhodospirillales bacterium]MBO6787128.1 hypothetical protein [Rhodospirillales bacterium]
MEWKTDPYWRYETFPLDALADSFGVFAGPVAMWREKAGPERPVPDWPDISLNDLEGWWGWTHVYDALDPSEAAFRVRLWGSRLAQVLGYDITGKIIRAEESAAAANPQLITRNDLEFARHLLDKGLIGRGSGPLNIEYDVDIDYFEIMLPMSADGRTFDKILNFCWIDDDVISR